jgi:type I restriction enzyme, S subunit
MTLVCFKDVITLSTSRTADPASAGIDRFVGLEHIEPENLHIRRWGLVADGTTFTNTFKRGQVLFGKRRAYQRKVAVADFDGVCSSDIYVFESKDPSVLLPELVPFICQSEGFYDYAVKTSAGSLSPRTNWSHLANYEFPLPPVDEQRRIADLLWAADDVISGHQDVLEKLENLNVRETEKLFSKGIDDSETTQTEIGNIPSHWELKQLQEVTSTVNNGFVGQSAKHYVSKGIPYLLGKNVRENRIDLDGLTYITKEFHESSIRSQLKTGDVLTVQSGHVGVSCVVPPEFDGANCHAIIISRPIPDVISGYFLSHYFNSQIGRQRLSGLYVGTTIPHINTSDLRKFKIPVPPFSEQKAIVEICETIVQRIKDIQNHIEISRNLKGQLLSKFLGN